MIELTVRRWLSFGQEIRSVGCVDWWGCVGVFGRRYRGGNCLVQGGIGPYPVPVEKGFSTAVSFFTGAAFVERQGG